MSLSTLVGPPNSGRAGLVTERVHARLGDRPFLAVPTAADVARFERELGAEGPVVGATVGTFAALVREVLAAAGAAAPPALTPAERLALVRAATDATSLRLLRSSARSHGFPAALDRLFGELGAALVEPEDLADAARAAGEGGHEAELADLYAAYEGLRERAGRSDPASLARAAIAALRARGAEAWRRRPLLLYGFDDLTEAQLEILRLLAAAADVVVTVTYAEAEPGVERRALAARAGLLARLEQELGAERERTLPPREAHTDRASLRHLGARLFEPQADRVGDDGGVRLLESAGERGEAEAVGLELGRLLAAGTPPDELVVVLRHPAREGPTFARVLHGLGIPVALEAEVELAATGVGASLIALCRAADADGKPADLLAHLRCDPSAPQGAVDWLERAVARGEASTVEELAGRWESPPAHLARVAEAADGPERLRAVALAARRLAEGPHREAAPLAGERAGRGGPMDPVELRAALAAAELLEELAALAALPGCSAPGLDGAARALAAASVPAWRGPTEGRVRITSPYRVRSGRASHLFCCGLQEGAFPAARDSDPLLGEAARARLGIRALRRRDQAEEERYLFALCVSRPRERLWLSWRASDEDGAPLPRSPFVDEVLDLVGEGTKESARAMTRSRGLAEPVPAAHEATTPRALARALALRHGLDAERHRDALAALGVPAPAAERAAGLLAGLPDPAAKPGPLRHPAVLADLAERRLLSAGSLERWIECSYRWFVSHELDPVRLEPPADPLWAGSVVHAALQRLYADPPGEDPVPREEDMRAWKRRLRELLDEEAGPERERTAERRLTLARVAVQVEAFLDEDARSALPLVPRPELLERSFGFDEDGDPGPLELGDFALRGRIDRIDVEPGGNRALLRDYKVSSSVTTAAKLAEEGKLQLQLYALAARKLGLEPIGAIYHPLAAAKEEDRRPRGILLRDECAGGGLLAGLRFVRGEPVDADGFDEMLERAEAAAKAAGRRMLSGDIARDPLGGECAKHCAFQPICRLERAVGPGEEGDGE